MNFSYWLRFAAPLILISALLFGLGVVAAWNVQRQQVLTSEVIAREVKSMVVEQDLYMNMREVHYRISQYLRTGDRTALDPVSGLCRDTKRLLNEAAETARTPEEKESVAQIKEGFDRFDQRYQQAIADGIDAADEPKLVEIVDEILTEDVLQPTKDAVSFNRAVVDRTNSANRETTDLMRQGFLFLGLTGGLGGLIVGLTVARALQRIILQLNVSVSGAAGTLEQVVGPVNMGTNGGFADLRTALRDMEQHISQVVERLRQRELEVLRNEQLAAIGQLAAGMAHEIRNPLMPMKMLVQSAMEKGNDAALGGRQLSVLAEEISRLEESIQNFLDFARPPTLEMHPVDLAVLIEQTRELVEARAQRQQVELSIHLPERECWLDGDATHLRQVLLNLLLNALDETPNGGRIAINVARDSAHESWQIDVSDTGRGLDAVALERIFEPFASSKETGTGLGLTICKRIIEAHGGTIQAANSTEGAVFTIRLPYGSRSLASASSVLEGQA